MPQKKFRPDLSSYETYIQALVDKLMKTDCTK